jgi:excisionase family DNA binding protein
MQGQIETGTNGHAEAPAPRAAEAGGTAVADAQAQEPTRARTAPLVEPLLWTIDQAAAALNRSTRTLKRMAAEGALPAGTVVRLGRGRLFNRRILEDWVARGCPAPARARGSRRR